MYCKKYWRAPFSPFLRVSISNIFRHIGIQVMVVIQRFQAFIYAEGEDDPAIIDLTRVKDKDMSWV